MKKPKQTKSSLLRALEFISFAQHDKGSEQVQHSILADNTAVAWDGVLAIGARIEESLEACPDTLLLMLALQRCGSEFALTQLAEDRLMVRSGDFQACIPCVRRNSLTAAAPDPALSGLSDSLTAGLKLALPLVDAKADRLLMASLQLNAGTLLATDGKVILEYWHGHSLPDGILIPKVAAQAIVKCGRSLTGFGFSGATATFWFGEDAWIRTQLFQDRWPDHIKRLLDWPTQPRPFNEAFFEAVKRVSPFSGNGMVYCKGSILSSHDPNRTEQLGSIQSELVVCPMDRAYDAESLTAVSKYATSFDENASQGGTLFFGEQLRGAIFHSEMKTKCPKCNDSGCDDCIPF